MLFLTFTNCGYLNLTENLAKNFQQTFMRHHTLVIECLDKESLKAAECWDISNVRPMRTIPAERIWARDFSDYNTLAFNQIVKCKFSLILHHLVEDVWYLDADVGICQDPALFIADFEKYDWLMQLDEPPPMPRNWCTGCFLVKNTQMSKIVLNGLLRFCADMSSGPYNDQEVFNWFIRSSAFDALSSKDEFSIAPLDKKLFQNGLNAFECGWHKNGRAVLVHANYRVGEREKIKALASCGKWFMRPATGKMKSSC
jgi:hypothetical protein